MTTKGVDKKSIERKKIMTDGVFNRFRDTDGGLMLTENDHDDFSREKQGRKMELHRRDARDTRSGNDVIMTGRFFPFFFWCLNWIPLW